MKLKTFRKDILRSVKNSLSRFIAIFAIVALGAGFYAGLNATAPDMQSTADKYCDDSRMFDVRLLSTLGFDEQDVAAIKRVNGVESVMAGYTSDVISQIDGKEQVIRIHSLPDDRSESSPEYLNRPVLVEGRLPQKDDECILGVSKLDTEAVKIGSVIQVEDKDGDLADTLKNDRFTVVGFVNSAYYISFSLGSSSMGNGTVSHYMYVMPSAFSSEAYTDLYLSVAGAREQDCFSDEYKENVDAVIDSLESLASERERLRFDDIYGEAKQKLDDAKQELADGKTELEDKRREADGELADAYNKLVDGKKEIDETEVALIASQNQLIDAQRTLNEKVAQFGTLKSNYKSGYAQYAAARAQYDAGMQSYDAGVASWRAIPQVAALAAAYPADADAILSAKRPSQAGITDPTAAAQYAAIYAGADVSGNMEQLNALKDTLDAGFPQLEATRLQLENAKAQLDAGEIELHGAQAKIDSGNEAVLSGIDKLADARNDITQGWSDYYEAKDEATQKIADAEQEIADAEREIRDNEKKLEDLKDCEWYVLSRSTNVGFASYDADTGRLASLSTVFPVMFFLVAALVALTTMTRMVEEERGIIGTYKALGYSSGLIILKYLTYAFVASVLGAAVGIVVGFGTLPVVCYNSYRLLYTAPDLDIQYNWKYAIEGGLASCLCTLGATYAACRSTLRERTASLLLPKAPKAGKRILLERIPFIWKRVSFIRKVTFRNLFRYKKRLIMTLVGIAGSAGLLLTGFGIKDSISDILHNQYDELYNFNTVITLDDPELSAQTQTLLSDPKNFDGYLVSAKKAVEMVNGDKTVQGFSFVPQSDSQDFYIMRDRLTHERVEFSGDDVVITEKAAKQLGVGVGDTVFIKDKDERPVGFVISGVCENYIYHYLYIPAQLYEQKMGEPPEYDEIDARCLIDDEQQRGQITNELLASEGVTTLTFTEDMSAKFDDMIQSLNYIVLVLILCAGALSFVVVYNLTNINITERRRELATIKVLGFFEREVCDYIFRETNMLTLLGAALGMGAGVVMHAFVITTVEVDIVMFGRAIKPMSFVISFLLTCLFSQLVNLFMRKKLAKIDMVESLKSIE